MLDYSQRIIAYKKLNPNELTPQQFRILENEIKTPEERTISDEYVDFQLWCNGLPSRQESFANFIAKKLSKNQGARVLEVGCGRTAKLSRILSDKGFKMTGIDPKVELQSNADMIYIKDHFDYAKFDLTEYDYVIAQEPCEATEHVIRACIAQNKPFIMSICGTPHRLISGETPKDAYKWWDYLINIGKSEVRFRRISLDPLFYTPILLKGNF